MKKIFKAFWCIVFIVSFNINAFTQATLSIGNINSSSGNSVSVPVQATGINDLLTFQFIIDYDKTKLLFLNCSNWASEINSAQVDIQLLDGKLMFGYFYDAINISNSKFFDLNFTIINGSSGVSAIKWSDIPLKRELSNSNANEISCSYSDGSVTISQANHAPVANAGPDQSVNEGTTVILDGSTSTDADGDTLTYKWTAPTGITISSTTVAKPTFIAPDISVNTNYTFSLVVNDGTVNSTADLVVITIAPVAVTYTLNVTATNGTVTKNPNKTPYNSGETVTLTATPNYGYTFSSWSGDASGSTNPLTVTMTGNKNITATFTAIEQNVTDLIVHYSSKSPVIDGVTDDKDPWTNDWIPLSASNPNNTTSGMSAKYQILSGNDAFYIAIAVKDATLSYDAIDIPNTYERDCSELFFSMDTVTEAFGAYKAGCWQIRTQRKGDDLFDGTSGVSVSFDDKPLLINDPKFAGASKTSSTEYVQELILPFSALTSEMKPDWDGKFFRFDIGVADNTTRASGGRTQQQFWHSNSDTQWNNTRSFGIAKLETNHSENTVNDVDSNEYTTVTIGNQVWMGQNLKTTHFNDGTEIPLVIEDNLWANLNSPGHCVYNNDISYREPFGALYNWYAVNTGKLCPTGWHVPSSDEWNILANFLGGRDVAGGKLKETGTVHWLDPNTGATNESSFSALPGGYRIDNGTFDKYGQAGSWWSDFENIANTSNIYGMYSYSESIVGYSNSVNFGLSIRCLQDETTGSLPSPAGTISGVTSVCQSSTNTYTVPVIADATSYIWTLPSGATGSSTTNRISVNFGAASGNITVKGHNTYGDGTASNLAITVTLLTLPTVSTSSINSITTSTATCGGIATANGCGTITTKGVCWSTSHNPTISNSKTIDGSGEGSFVSKMTGLDQNTKYYIRSYATNDAGTAYGNEISFTTNSELNPPLNLTATADNVNSQIVLSWSAPSSGLPTDYTIYFSESENGTYTALTPNFIDTNILVQGVVNGITYWFYVTANYPTGVSTASNKANTSIGNTIKDVDGNEYTTVTIGTQVWMGQNLKTTHYNDGTDIPLVTNDNTWANMSNPAYCWYNNDIGYKDPYGALYNWHAVNKGNLCPLGWHVPTNDEWNQLTDYLGGRDIAGGKLKETGTTYWLDPNTGATNETGFSAIACGQRSDDGTFSYPEYFNYSAQWWQSTNYGDSPNYYGIYSTDAGLWGHSWYAKLGLSVRCLEGEDVTSSSIREKINELILFPNPTNGIVEISLNEPLETDINIEVYNNLGGLMRSISKSAGAKSTKIDLSQFPSGIYMIKINSRDKLYVGKIIKK